MAALNHPPCPSPLPSGTVPWVPNSPHAKPDLDQSSHFHRVQVHNRHTYRLTDHATGSLVLMCWNSCIPCSLTSCARPVVLGDLGYANVDWIRQSFDSIHCCYVSRSFINKKVYFEVYLLNYQYLFNCN